MNDLQDAPEEAEREVQHLAALLLIQAERVNELACLLVERIEQRLSSPPEES